MIERSAFTAIELLVLISLLLAVGVALLVVVQRPSIGSEANAVSRRVAQLRGVAVVTGDSSSCLDRTDVGAFATAVPPRGLLFTPDGLPRACDGGGVGNTTILLEHRGRQAAVIVSSLGRVRWELR